MKKLHLAAIMTLSCLLAVNSQTSRDLAQYVGEKATYLDQDISSKGYYHIKTEKNGYDSYSYWWNSSKSKCVVARTNDGRIASIMDAMPFDCNKSANNTPKYNQSYHNQHHHSNSQHYSDGNVDNAYDRGFSDGLHNKTYHNIYNQGDSYTEAYAGGYSAGVEQRKSNTSHHSNKGGYAAHVRITDLKGQNAELAYSELKTRGFAEQRKHSSGDKTYRVFYNSKTQQCIKTTSISKRIAEIQNSTNCD